VKKDRLDKDLADVVAKIQKSKRDEVREQIIRLQKIVGSTEDLFVDGRSKMWKKGGSARAKVEARPRKSVPAEYKVSWRGGGSIECSAAEAAKIAKKTTIGLGLSVSKTGSFNVSDGDELITIKRL
jgi:hypothetical protein